MGARRGYWRRRVVRGIVTGRYRMSIAAPWPASVTAALAGLAGAHTDVERLGGMSGATVWRARLPRHSFIVKASPRPTERRFYESVAATLRQHAIASPTLHQAVEEDGVHWLVLEDIASPLPRDRWLADPDLLATLRRLHAIEWSEAFELPDAFVPRWSGEMTGRALSCVPDAVATPMASLLRDFASASQHLFHPLAPISGDPNPSNWGIRPDGTLVLFDWERFSRGTPPLDLAITVPGLGDPADYALVAARYLAKPGAEPGLPAAIEHLAREIGLAKVWTVVEFLNGHTLNPSERTKPMVEFLIPTLPAWLKTLNHARS